MLTDFFLEMKNLKNSQRAFSANLTLACFGYLFFPSFILRIRIESFFTHVSYRSIRIISNKYFVQFLFSLSFFFSWRESNFFSIQTRRKFPQRICIRSCKRTNTIEPSFFFIFRRRQFRNALGSAIENTNFSSPTHKLNDWTETA